ncbi:glucosamine-6-phosphate deaminase [Pisciglobus halotolerans]|uniref:Glucosamine-6-phosphate deaminase n=1 Tax=Pisciglobus halotolerans TaxID=745365 RepID=A0A1I3BNC6_9LACT|nr:glucosamine-6-phosphate deaminase [Pisciglobus halotolerans]SFH63753.1 glucosamine-6-phosphate deaminase [Pisciglobus halotolerans]
MQTIFVKDYDEMSQKAYELVREVIEKNEDPVLSLNTGGTPRGLFKHLVEGINNGLDIRKATLFNLDEYVGPKGAVYTVRTYMYENLFNLIQDEPKHAYLIDSAADNLEKEIERYKDLLSKHKRNIQILGLGTNGHIGANEPGTPFDSTMFLAKHEESTIQSTMKEYGIIREEAPTEMITLGFTEILDAEKVVLLVSGEHKAEAVKAFLEGEITTECPVTALRNHDNVIVIIDEAAASLLEK